MIVLENGDDLRASATNATEVDFTVHGLDNNALKQLADGQLAASEGSIYLANSTDVVTTVILVNTGAAHNHVNLYLKPSAGTSRRLIPKDLQLESGYSLHFEGGKCLILNNSGAIISTIDTSVFLDDTAGGTDGLTTKAPTSNAMYDLGVSKISHSLATAVNDFLAASGAGAFVKKTLAEVKTILGLGSAAYTASGDYATAAQGVTNGDSHDHAGGDGAQVDHGGLGGLGDDDHTQYILKTLYDAYSILMATTDNTPVAITIAEQQTVGRLTGGAIKGLSVAELQALLFSAGLPENVEITLSTALTADGKYSGLVIPGTAGATLAFGEVCYLAAVDSRWELAKADSATTSGGLKLGMCVLAAANDGSATKMLRWGNIRADAKFPTMTIGGPVYLSAATAGLVTSTIPVGAGNIERILGHANTGDEMEFNPEHDWQTHV